jgi:dolichol-phosphate mannosyltransferase
VKLSVVIPCFNERANVDQFPTELIPELQKLDGCRWEIIGVDDGSTDGTSDALAKLPQITIIRNPRNRGLGAALRAGFAQACGEWIVALDADLTFHPRHIKDLIARQKETGADMVGGSPFLGAGGMSRVDPARRVPSLLVNAFYRGLFNRRLTSYTGIFRLYRASALKALDLKSQGFEINAEIAARLHQSGKKLQEVPVPLTTRTLGASKLNILRELRRHALLVARLCVTRP